MTSPEKTIHTDGSWTIRVYIFDEKKKKNIHKSIAHFTARGCYNMYTKDRRFEKIIQLYWNLIFQTLVGVWGKQKKSYDNGCNFLFVCFVESSNASVRYLAGYIAVLNYEGNHVECRVAFSIQLNHTLCINFDYVYNVIVAHMLVEFACRLVLGD